MKNLIKLLSVLLLVSCMLLFVGCEALGLIEKETEETTDETVNETPDGGSEETPDEKPGGKPGTDDPGTDDPGTDDPGTDDPGTDDPGTNDPGTDDPEDPTENDGVVIDGVATVYTAEKLLELIAQINSGEVSDDITIELGKDIDLFEMDFTPIYRFCGTIDGKGYKISNISLPIDGAIVESTDGNWVGYDIIYIGFISSAYDVTIRNLTLDGVRFDEETEEQIFVGALVGYTEGLVIENCKVTSKIYAGVFHPEVGYRDISGMSGLIGYSLDAYVENTTIDCLIDYTANSYEAFAGPVLGVGNVRVQSCDIKLDIRFSGDMYGHTGYVIGMERTPDGITLACMYDSKVNGTLNINNPRGYAWGAVGQGYLYNPETREFQDLEADNIEINITNVDN